MKKSRHRRQAGMMAVGVRLPPSSSLLPPKKKHNKKSRPPSPSPPPSPTSSSSSSSDDNSQPMSSSLPERRGRDLSSYLPPSPLPSPRSSCDSDDNSQPISRSLSLISERRRRRDVITCLRSHHIAQKIRIQRQAFPFRETMYYGPEREQRILIRQNGGSRVWYPPSSRVSWIGVYGTDTACVITMMDKEALRLRPRPPSGKSQLCVRSVLGTALADMFPEVVGPDAPTDLLKRCALVEHTCSGVKEEVVPYAVVSVAPGFARGVNDDHEVQQALLATHFLKAALKDQSSLTSIETKQIATCALKCLLGPKFQADKTEMDLYGFHFGELGRMSAHEVDQYMAQMKLTKSFP